MYQTTLYDKILSEGQLSDHESATISAFLASIVRYLHKKNIIIRNLRPDFILIDNKDILEVKLVDLSLAIEVGDNSLLNKDVNYSEFRRLSSNF
jgi:serine/threonine protein kinase